MFFYLILLLLIVDAYFTYKFIKEYDYDFLSYSLLIDIVILLLGGIHFMITGTLGYSTLFLIITIVSMSHSIFELNDKM